MAIEIKKTHARIIQEALPKEYYLLRNYNYAFRCNFMFDIYKLVPAKLFGFIPTPTFHKIKVGRVFIGLGDRKIEEPENRIESFDDSLINHLSDNLKDVDFPLSLDLTAKTK